MIGSSSLFVVHCSLGNVFTVVLAHLSSDQTIEQRYYHNRFHPVVMQIYASSNKYIMKNIVCLKHCILYLMYLRPRKRRTSGFNL